MLEISNRNDENLECAYAADRTDKSISIKSNTEPNIAKNDIAIGLNTAQGEPLITQKASDEDSSSDTDNDDVNLDTNKNAFDLIKEYRLKNTNKVILAHLNINSIRNKFSSLKELVSDNIDVLVIEETKLDETFPEKAFMIPGYKKTF